MNFDLVKLDWASACFQMLEVHFPVAPTMLPLRTFPMYCTVALYVTEFSAMRISRKQACSHVHTHRLCTTTCNGTTEPPLKDPLIEDTSVMRAEHTVAGTKRCAQLNLIACSPIC